MIIPSAPIGDVLEHAPSRPAGSARALRLRLSPPRIGETALCLVYVWFGVLKVAGTSPAASLVAALQSRTLPFLDPAGFLVGLGVYEMLVGMLLLSARSRRVGLALLGLHMLTTFLPLLMLPEVTWNGFPALTIEGQYIVKNVVIVALALGLARQRR